MPKFLTLSIILLIIGLVIGLVFGFNFIFKDKEPVTYDECKMKYWEECGLTVNSNNKSELCYRIEGKNSTKWAYCQVVSQEIADCWVQKSNECYVQFVLIPAEENQINDN